jgi:argininosuccinate synthase
MKRIVVAYGGDLTTSVAIRWLADRHGAEIVTLSLDVGQGKDLEQVRDRALAIGAARAHVLDVREEFARRFVLPSLKAGALDDGRYPMPSPLARPLIARKLVEIAEFERSGAVAHGGAEHGVLDAALRTLDSPSRVIAAPSGWVMGRSAQLDYAAKYRIPLPPDGDRAGAADVNLWGRTVTRDSGSDADPEPSDDSCALTRSPRDCPDAPAYVEIAFEGGMPTAINGVSLPLVDLISTLTMIAGAHGVGRRAMPAGGPSHPLVEAPAAVVLHMAHHELQSRLAPDVAPMARNVAAEYATVVRHGRWFTPLRGALDAFVEAIQPSLTGNVRLKLFRADVEIVPSRDRQPSRVIERATPAVPPPGFRADARAN